MTNITKSFTCGLFYVLRGNTFDFATANLNLLIIIWKLSQLKLEIALNGDLSCKSKAELTCFYFMLTARNTRIPMAFPWHSLSFRAVAPTTAHLKTKELA
jgi:hypothetical protein